MIRPGRRGRVAAAAAVLVVASTGCGGARLTDGRAVVVIDKGFQVSPPRGWERVPGEADLAVRDVAGGAGLMAHGTCGDRTSARAPSILARHLRFGLREVRDLAETPAVVSGYPGTRSQFTARLDARRVAVSAVTIVGGGCVYDLVAVVPADQPAALTEAFERFVASFGPVEGRP